MKSRTPPCAASFSPARKQPLQKPALWSKTIQVPWCPWHGHRGLWKATHETPSEQRERGKGLPGCPRPPLRHRHPGPAQTFRRPPESPSRPPPRAQPGPPPQALGRRYLGGPDLADAGFLGQAADAADEAERVAELLPAGLKHGALGRGHELGRIARPTAPRHGRRGRAPPPPPPLGSAPRAAAGQGGEVRPGGGPSGAAGGAGPVAEAHPPAAAAGRDGRRGAGAWRGGGGSCCRVSSSRPPGLPPPAPSPSRSRSSSPEVTRLALRPPPEGGAAVAFRSKK